VVGGKGFKNPLSKTGSGSLGPQSTRIHHLIDKQSTISDKDQFFWRVALDKNCPPSLKGRLDKVKTEMSLNEVVRLIEVLEIEAAVEEAFHLDEELKNKNTGGKR